MVIITCKKSKRLIINGVHTMDNKDFCITLTNLYCELNPTQKQDLIKIVQYLNKNKANRDLIIFQSLVKQNQINNK